MSSIRSTSSITNTLRLLPSKFDVSSRCYSRRPGVAIIIFMVAICWRSNSTSFPPIIRAALRSCNPPKDLRTSKACMPSSRVGTSIKAPRPSNCVQRSLYSYSTTGIRYESVFPLPVRALQTMSRPLSAWRIDDLYTSVILINFDLKRPFWVHFDNGRSLNLILIFVLSFVSRMGC